MISLHHRGIDSLALAVYIQPERFELVGSVQGIVDQCDGTATAKYVDDSEHSREGGLLDASAVARTEYHDDRAGQVAVCPAEQLDAALRHLSVRLARGAHNGRGRVAVEVEPRIDRDAMAAHGDSWAMEVAERLRVARLDDTVDVDADAICIKRELVGQADVDVAIGRLRQLGQFRRLG